jgi:lysozyme
MSEYQPTVERRTVEGMIPSTDYETLCKTMEGLRLAAYDDGGGTLTIGWGHIKQVHHGAVINIEQAQQYFEQDTLEAVTAIYRNVTAPISQGEFDALTDWVFNLGEGHLLQSTGLRLLNARRYPEAIDALSWWDKIGRRTMLGLKRRRAAEAYLWKNGRLPSAL